MTTLHRVKAYFGMVPADELDSYDGYDDDRYDSGRDRHPVERHTGDRHPDRHRYAADRFDDRFDARVDDRDHDGGYDRYGRGRREDDDRYDRYDRYDDRERRTPRPRDPEVTEIRRDEMRRDEEPATESTPRAGRGRSWATNTGPSHTSARPTAHRTPPSLSSTTSGGSAGSAASSAAETAATPAVKGPTAVPSAVADPDPASGPAEITSLQPKSYNEARLIGERYRDGIPVIMNLTEMDDAGAKRLVDFAAGLAFALRGSIEKVTNRVFLLSPPNVEVSASDRRKLAEKNYASTS